MPKRIHIRLRWVKDSYADDCYANNEDPGTPTSRALEMCGYEGLDGKRVNDFVVSIEASNYDRFCEVLRQWSIEIDHLEEITKT